MSRKSISIAYVMSFPARVLFSSLSDRILTTIAGDGATTSDFGDVGAILFNRFIDN